MLVEGLCIQKAAWNNLDANQAPRLAKWASAPGAKINKDATPFGWHGLEGTYVVRLGKDDFLLITMRGEQLITGQPAARVRKLYIASPGPPTLWQSRSATRPLRGPSAEKCIDATEFENLLGEIRKSGEGK